MKQSKVIVFLLLFLSYACCQLPLLAQNWTKTYPGLGINSFDHVVETADDGFATVSEDHLVKLDVDGVVQYNKEYADGSNHAQIVQTDDGGYAIVGWTEGHAFLLHPCCFSSRK